MYWQYWKRGWWSLLMQTCGNLIGVVVMLPVALVFSDNLTAYCLTAAGVFLVGVLPITGWLFEAFVKHSRRIGVERPHDCPSTQ